MVAAVLAALAASPVSIYHYREPAWWGRPVDVRVAVVRRDGDWAAAKVVAPTGTQWLLLYRSSVVATVTGDARRFYCRLAPPHVVRTLVGRCQTYGRFDDDFEIVGPVDRKHVAGSWRGCKTAVVYASELDPSYEEVDNCAASGGSYFLRNGKVFGFEVDGPGCDWAPPGIIRSLHGRCLLVP